MSNFYAQIDANGVVIGISDLGGEYLNSSYIIIPSYDLSLLGHEYTGPTLPGTLYDPANFSNEAAKPYGGPTSNIAMIFPELKVDEKDLFLVRDIWDHNDTTKKKFWDTIAGETDPYWDSNYTSLLQNTDDQTIIDLQGSGILTNVISPIALAADATMTITVIIDGESRIFKSVLLSDSERYVLGFAEIAKSSNYRYAGLYHWELTEYSVLTPEHIYANKIGMVFKSSLKITIQCDKSISTSGYRERAAVSYLTYIPEGF